MSRITTTDYAHAYDNIHVGVYDVSRFDGWDDLSDADKLARLQAAEPDRSTSSHNTTCVGLDELRAETLAETYGVEKATAFALGTGDSEPRHNNRSINNKVGEVDISEYSPVDTQLVMNGFAGSEQLNGTKLTEIGTVSDAGRLLNHAIFTPVEKNAGEAVHFEVTIAFSDQ